MAVLCADIGEATLASNLLNSCEGENMEEDEEVLVDLFVAWTETRYLFLFFFLTMMIFFYFDAFLIVLITNVFSFFKKKSELEEIEERLELKH